MRSILMITIELPYPPTSGGRMKSWNMLNYLARHYRIGLATPLKYGSDQLEPFRKQVKLVDLLHDRVEVSRSAANLLKSYIKGLPLNVYRSRSERLIDEVSRIIDSYDMVLLDHYESFQYLPASYRGKVLFHTHNATYLMWERYATSGANLPYRLASRLEAGRVRSYERQAASRADLVFAAPNDIDSLVAIGVDRDHCRVTYHLGDDSQLSLPSLRFDESEKSLLYIGTLSWEANVDGLLWFLEQVWPLARQHHPDLRFHIVGGNPDPRLVAAVDGAEGVELVGFVDELEPWFRRCRLFVAPLRFGAGIKVKVLNAMARGLPTVTTPVGSEGLIAESMLHLAIASEADEMAEAIDRLLVDRNAWLAMEQASRQLVRENYTWERVLGDMVNEIEGLEGEEQ